MITQIPFWFWIFNYVCFANKELDFEQKKVKCFMNAKLAVSHLEINENIINGSNDGKFVYGFGNNHTK